MKNLRIRRLVLHASAGIRVGNGPNERTRFDCGPESRDHVAIVGPEWVAVWTDGDEEAVLVHGHQVKEIRTSKADVLAAIGEPEPRPTAALKRAPTAVA